MNSKRYLLLVLIFVISFSLAGCSGAGENSDTSSVRSSMLKKNDFAFLKKGMRVKDVVSRINQPYRDVGSGLYIIVYKIAEGAITLHFDGNLVLDDWEVSEQ